MHTKDSLPTDQALIGVRRDLNEQRPQNPARRALLKTGAGSAALSLFGMPMLFAGCGGSDEPAPAEAPAVAAEPGVVETANGRLRGLVDKGVSFKGVRYAADAGGANRFMPPQPIPNWTGIRDALAFGNRSIQAGRGGAQTTQAPQNSEDCCFLNVYTPDLNPNARRPVMLWLHGGGFRSGAGDAPMLDGRSLANFGDVVVITINHRLNLFGYLPIGEMDPAFADAGNVGQLDIIAALRWVQTNIRQFGGDPDNVTVFGQSGGGSKIHTLLLMPAADGLYHRAINMSGPTVFEMDSETNWRPLMEEFLTQLGISDRRNLRQLQELTPAQLLAAHGAAVRKLGTDDFRPVVDGRNVAYGPLSPQGLRMKPSVPLMMGTTDSEATIFLRSDPRNATVTDQQVRARIAAQFGVDDARAAALMAAYRQNPQNGTAWEVLRAFASDTLFRGRALLAADSLSTARQQPLYLYNFVWREPTAGGIWGSPHAYDIPFVFGTTDLVTSIPDADDASAVAASRNMMSAFVAFARTGNPNNAQIPTWPRYDTNSKQTMTISSTCRVVDDYRGIDRQASLPFMDQETFKLLEGPLFAYSA